MRPSPVPRDGQRRQARIPTARPIAVLTSDGRSLPGEIADVTRHGCRLLLACDLAPAQPLTVAVGAGALIAGQVTRNDGCSIGVEFCSPLLARMVEALRAPD